MKIPAIKAPRLVNILIVIISAIIGGFSLLFGLAHLIEGRNHSIPYSEHIKGVIICLGLCLLGLICAFIFYAAVKGLGNK
ncbi:MAG: hypothetical protein HKO92_11690 [Flavobacteriaceae bacterium]|nr:hypothetical protein [Flavobacteriaceae bacterium]